LAVIRKAYTDSLLKEHQRQLVNQLSRQLHESQQLLLFLRNQLSSPIPESAQRTLDELSQKLRSIEA
jgi:hypothetical protein